jgi:hypothetical protein
MAFKLLTAFVCQDTFDKKGREMSLRAPRLARFGVCAMDKKV